MNRSAILGFPYFLGTSIGMNLSLSVAATLSNDARKDLAILSLSKAEPIAHLAEREGVSRQFLYRQKQKAVEALDEAFADKNDDVIFYLPVTEAWLNQLTLARENAPLRSRRAGIRNPPRKETASRKGAVAAASYGDLSGALSAMRRL
jgi:hypothetical protein